MSLKKVVISKAHWCLGESLGIYFSPLILAFSLEIKKLTIIEFIANFEVEISIGDIFAVTPFMTQLNYKNASNEDDLQ